jgi:hypothetical protein
MQGIVHVEFRYVHFDPPPFTANRMFLGEAIELDIQPVSLAVPTCSHLGKPGLEVFFKLCARFGQSVFKVLRSLALERRFCFTNSCRSRFWKSESRPLTS